jgi:presequence protease
VLQVCSEVDKPDPPGQAARKAFFRNLIGLSDEARETFKKSLLEVSREKILAAAEAYFGEDAAERAIAVISSEEKLVDANRKLKENPLKLFRI